MAQGGGDAGFPGQPPIPGQIIKLRFSAAARATCCTITGPDSGEEELKLYGSAAEAGQDLRGEAANAWWRTWPAEKAAVFFLHIRQAIAIEWDTGDGLMTVHQ